MDLLAELDPESEAPQVIEVAVPEGVEMALQNNVDCVDETGVAVDIHEEAMFLAAQEEGSAETEIEKLTC